MPRAKPKLTRTVQLESPDTILTRHDRQPDTIGRLTR